KQDPILGDALYGLVDLALPTDDDIASLAAELANRNDLAPADSINARFAHAKILDHKGEYAEAFKFFDQANTTAMDDLAARGIRYEREEVEARIDRTIKMYPADSFEKLTNPLPIELTPIFVLGMPRSGTTLFEQILASHPDVEAGGELIFGHQCERWFREERLAVGRSGRIDLANDDDRALLEAARERYIDALFENDLDGQWVVDKMPANFEITGFLRMLFPDAPIIHTLRDARATCFSLYTANFSAHEPYYHRLEDLAHYYDQYLRLMAHWRAVVPAPFIEMSYEDLARAPGEQIPAMLRAVGLSEHPDCLQFHRHERPVLSASHAQVRRPMYTDAIDHWRHYESWLGPVAEL
ncbi:MAG: sulfotransferase, partial [Pseudomonadales bacterium]|nr:sulfotransferase [Pseudomonadales bacterium]